MKASRNATATESICWGVSPSAARLSEVRTPCLALSPIAWSCAGARPRPGTAGVNALLSWVVKIAPSTAMPRTPPTSRLVFVLADPRPARSRPTRVITAPGLGAHDAALAPNAVHHGRGHRRHRRAHPVAHREEDREHHPVRRRRGEQEPEQEES